MSFLISTKLIAGSNKLRRSSVVKGFITAVVKKGMGIILNRGRFLSVQATAVPSRAEIPEQFRWVISDIYPDDAAWEDDYKQLLRMIPELQGLQGTLGSLVSIY